MERIRNIQPLDKTALLQAKQRWDAIAKPLSSLGRFEDMIQQLAGIQGTADVTISRRTVVVLCADHGVVREGVSQCGSEVTAICAKAIAAGTSNINALADAFGAQVLTVDMGICQDLSCPGLLDRKIIYGTQDFTTGMAMTEEQAVRCIQTGMDLVRDLKAQGCQLVLTGEMGIGNTTSASALAAVLLDCDPALVTGRGAGLPAERLARKIAVIRQAIAANREQLHTPLSLLAALGGAEIAGMTGIFLGGAYYRIPVVIDGVISAAAAAIAYRMQPLCRDYLLASHASGEPAGTGLLELIGLQPVLYAGMRLGEGTGAVMLLPLLDGALALYRNAHRFDDLPMERYVGYK